jgi:hypothetical protein
MASQQGKGKKPRKHKVSRGERRSSLPVHLTEIQKVLMGKGLLSKQSPR